MITANGTAKHGGLTFEHEGDMDGGNIWVSKGKYSASITCAMDTGSLESNDRDYPLSADQMETIEAVCEYAEANGLY